MARTKTAAVRKSKPPAGPQVVGETKLVRLDAVKKNPWNPNRMTPFEKESLKQGFRKDGWIASQALLVWGEDEKGRQQNLIIDGEHRWTAARELGMVEGPMVFLFGISEQAAKALTIKMNQKRGKFDEEALGNVLRELSEGLDIETRSLDLGISEERLAEYIKDPVIEEPGGVIGELPSGQTSHVRMVQLFFQEENHDEFTRLAKDLAVRFKVGNLTDTVLEAVRRAHAAPAQK